MHEGEHNRALGDAIHAFIQQHRPELARQLGELKRRSAVIGNRLSRRLK
jgi:hypothetical protein